MKNLLVVFAAIFGFGLFVSPSTASDCAVDEYDHNGSTMEVQECSDGLNISYIKPRNGLAKIGVLPGTLLFEGRISRIGSVSGQARLFSAKCGVIAYEVNGVMRPNSILMTGRAPRRNDRCQVTGYRDDELLFTLNTYVDRSTPDDWYAITGSFRDRNLAQNQVDDLNGRYDDWFVLNTRECPNFTNGYWIATIGPLSKSDATEWKEWTQLSDTYIKTCN